MKQLGKCMMLLVLASSCAPVLSDLQSARHLEEGKSEVTPSIGYLNWTNNTEVKQIHAGVQAGYGLSNKLEARFRYEFISADVYADPTLETSKIDVHTLGFGAKYSIVSDKLSFYLPIGVGFGSEINTKNTWQMQPTILFTHRFSKHVEFTPSIKYVATFSKSDDFLGFNLGLGLSSDLDKWVIRPEFGTFEGFNVGGRFNHFSVGFSVRN